MRRLARRLGLTGATWIAVIAVAGATLAGAITGNEALTVSPAETTVEAGDVVDVTVGLTGGEASSSYAVTVSYGGDSVGSCQTDSASIDTDAEGSGSWTCSFTSAGTETATGTAMFDVAGVGAVTATIHVEPDDGGDGGDGSDGGDDGGDGDGEGGDTEGAVENHGQCVSEWGHRAKAEGLHGRFYGRFKSRVARSDCTGSGDDAEIAGWLAEALAAQEAASADGEGSSVQAGGGKGAGKGAGTGSGGAGKAKGKVNGTAKGRGKPK